MQQLNLTAFKQNAVKYFYLVEKKRKTSYDLEKALWYLSCLPIYIHTTFFFILWILYTGSLNENKYLNIYSQNSTCKTLPICWEGKMPCLNLVFLHACIFLNMCIPFSEAELYTDLRCYIGSYMSFHFI